MVLHLHKNDPTQSWAVWVLIRFLSRWTTDKANQRFYLVIYKEEENFSFWGLRARPPWIKDYGSWIRSWIKANESDISNYCCMLSDRLCRIKLPTNVVLFNNLRCSDPAHFNAMNLYAKYIADACNVAAMASIPLTCNRQACSQMSGWSEFVQPIRDKSLFWHRMWLDCDHSKTVDGDWNNVMKSSCSSVITSLFEISKKMSLLYTSALLLQCWTTMIKIFGQKLNEFVAIELT